MKSGAIAQPSNKVMSGAGGTVEGTALFSTTVDNAMLSFSALGF